MIHGLFVPACIFVAGLLATGAGATADYDSATRIFRLDGGDVTYAFGVDAAGIDPARLYRMRAIDGAPAPDDPVQSGAYWMAQGADIQMRGDLQAVGRIFDAVARTLVPEQPSS